MLSRIRRRLSYANVMATMAVFIALGGSSYAAITITSKNVRNGTLVSADLKDNAAVKSADVVNGTLLAKDFKTGELVAGAPGPQGPKGDTGATGPQGPGGAPGASGADGRDGIGILTRMQSTNTAPVVSGDGGGAATSIPLTGDQLTIQANEMTIGYGEIAVDPPDTCFNAGGRLGISFQVGNFEYAARYIDWDGGGATVVQLDPIVRLGEPDPRTVDVDIKVWDSCMNPGERWQVNGFRSNVISAR